MQPKRMTPDEIQKAVRSAIQEARSFIESEIAPDRLKAARYYKGEVDIGSESGRSKVVATKCRDNVRAVKPSLMRIFMQTDKAVEVIPSGDDDVEAAEQQTNYANWKFYQQNGFRVLSDVFHDALVKKAGFTRVYYDETPQVDFEEYEGLTDEEFAFVAGDEDVEILEHSEYSEQVQMPDGSVVEALFHDAKIAHTTTKGEIKIESIAPEDFFIDANATCIDDAVCVGYAYEGTVGDMVAMGFDYKDVVGLDTTDDEAGEEYERQIDPGDDDEADPSLRRILITQAFVKLDAEGTGVPQLYSLVCGGTNFKIFEREKAEEIGIADFQIDPEPHRFFGKSLVELLIEDQDASTSLMRGLLDNIALINTPRTILNDKMVNMDDVLNNEIGGIIRAKDITQYQELVVPPVGMSVLPALQYYDQAIEGKTGVTRASMGLDPDALQSTTATAVNATVQAASGQAEVIARHLAEGGMRRTCELILKLAKRHATAEEHMRIDGKFVPVDPRSWTTDMDMTVNVGLGTGQDQERLMALQGALQTQMAIWQTYGPDNGLVTMTQIRNTLADILSFQGVKNADRYYQPMDQQREYTLHQQAAAKAAQAQQSDPNAMLAQAEMQSAQIEAQASLQKAAMDQQTQMQKAAMEDDRKRDESDAQMVLKAAELLGKHKIQVNQARIKAMQAQPRQPGQ